MRLHPGSSGFWRNWRNHYDDDLFSRLLVEALSGSPVRAAMFDTTGNLVDGALALFDDIYDFGGTSDDQKLTADPASYPDNPTCLKKPGLPDGTEGMFYSSDIPVGGGQPPYTFTITGDALPPGLFLDANSEEISGNPDAIGLVAKTFTFTVRAADSGSGPDEA